VEVSDRTRRGSDRNKVPTTTGLHKKDRRTLRKAHGKYSTNVPEYYEDSTKGRDEVNTTVNTAIGMISKTLFGTMDANDAQIVNEQLELLRNNQKTVQHAVQNQLKILDATIGHTDRLEKTLTYNENLLANTTQRIGAQLARSAQQEDIIEHLIIITTIMTDLSQDIENFIDFLTNTASGLILTRLLTLERIIKELREAATHLTKGLHFPFKIQIENWRTIQKYMTINAYTG